jgi:molecular chaperone HscC
LSTIIGIDLGTTNSLAAAWIDGQSVLIPNALGQHLTPSCVSIDQDGTVLVGQAAKERLQSHPERSTALFKRIMGTQQTIMMAGKPYRAEELSALVLKSLKADAEAFLGYPVTEAVITVPAYFSDAQRKATRIAGQLAGLTVERLINEPTAAALAYGLHQAGNESQFLVFDLGGGTFDVSILELFEGVMEVRATAGDNFLGGEDFVNALWQAFIQHTHLPEAAQRDPLLRAQLMGQLEESKKQLSSQPSIDISITWRDTPYTYTLDEAEFAKISEPLLSRLRQPVERAMRDASIRAASLDSVVLAGGSTRMPMIRRMVARMFGRFPAVDINPDEVVALGAAVQAGLKMKDAALDEIVMTDVSPYSLGVDVVKQLEGGQEIAGYFSPIIERNTVVPVSRVEQFRPIRDNQKEIQFEIFQGESRLVKDNIKLGEISVPLPPKSLRSQTEINVRFSYDVNGLLEVEIQLQGQEKRHRLVIEGNPGVLNETEIAERLAKLSALKIHPRDKTENRTLMAQAERQFQQLRGHQRDWLGHEISLFEVAVNSQDDHLIISARKKLHSVLQQLGQHDVFADETDPNEP